MSFRCVVLLAIIYSFGLVISLDDEPRSIKNIKDNLCNYYVNACYVKEGNITPSSVKYILHPNYLKAVHVARQLLLEDRIDDGRKTLVSATKAMIMKRPDLTESQSLVDALFVDPQNMCQPNIKMVVDSFVKDVASEKKKRKFNALD